MAFINTWSYIDDIKYETYGAQTDGPYVYGPVTITVDNGKKTGDIQTRTATMSVYDATGQSTITQGKRKTLSINVQNTFVFDGYISDISITTARKTRMNPNGHGIEAQITATNTKESIKNYEIVAQDGFDSPKTFPQMCAIAQGQIQSQSGWNIIIVIPPQTHLENITLSEKQIREYSGSIEGFVSYLAQSQGYRATFNKELVTFHAAKRGSKPDYRIPSTAIHDGIVFIDNKQDTLNSISITFRPADGSLRNPLLHNANLDNYPLQQEYGINRRKIDLNVFGQTPATRLASQMLIQPEEGFRPNKITINLGRYENLGLSSQALLKHVFTYNSEYVPSVYIDAYDNTGIKIVYGGIVNKATLTINPAQNWKNPTNPLDRALLTLEIGNEDLKPVPNKTNPPINTWGTNPYTYAATPLTTF